MCENIAGERNEITEHTTLMYNFALAYYGAHIDWHFTITRALRDYIEIDEHACIMQHAQRYE